MDISKAEDAENLVNNTLDLWGKIDILFNNAGVELLKSIEETSIEDVSRVIDINLGNS